MLTLILGLALAAPPGAGLFLTDDSSRDIDPEVVAFRGPKVSITLKASKHRVRLRDVLLDLVLEPGAHLLKESGALQLPGPLMLVSCSKTNKVDGEVFALGTAGIKLKGPKVLSVFALEPFITRFPNGKLRTVRDNGASIFSAESIDVVQVPDDYRYSLVVGLDPTAKYKVSVAGKGTEQVIVIADREFDPSEDLKPADAAWSASRAVLKGGGSAELPSTRQVAFTLAGTDAVFQGDSKDAAIEVFVELVKPGTGELGPPRSLEVGTRSKRFIVLVSKQLLAAHSLDAARALVEQCVSSDPRNAECHLIYARVWAEAGSAGEAISQACLALRYDEEGTAVGDEARALLGKNRDKCP